MYLADIGNRYAHLYSGKEIVDLEIDELIKEYRDKKLYYINVNPNNAKKLEAIENWINLAPFVKLNGAYSSMGIDRQVLLLSASDGIYIDAGSAITIDLKRDNKFIGGTILPGIWKLKSCYADISSKLEIDEISKIDINKLPSSNTQETISYGIIAPIIALINSINRDNLPIYCCGGDGKLIASYLENANFNKELIFEGMKKVIKEIKC